MGTSLLILREASIGEKKMKIEVYYWKSEHGSDYLHDKTPSIGEFHSDFIKVPFEKNPPIEEKDYPKEFTSKVCDSIYHILNCEENPLGTPENQEFIRENKLHTSMSVGDIISIDEKEFWIVKGIGFDKLWN